MNWHGIKLAFSWIRCLKYLFFTLVFFNTAYSSDTVLLTQQEWSQPKKVETILQMKAIKNVLMALDSAPESRITINYPGGDEGTLWAHELKAWLVSLGVLSEQIKLRPGSGDAFALEIQIESPRPDSTSIKP